MIKDFKYYIEKTLYLQVVDKILLTISGGADSITMLDLFSKLNYSCGIAHCNFHLRGKDSDGDELFVQKLSEKYNLPYYKTDFDTRKYAKEKGISIEMAARELRYNWFEEIRKNDGYQYIATAHHKDDAIETFFINLTRGTGIRGLTGIKEKNAYIIRPLLFCNRQDILKYIEDNKLNYREDVTNSDVKIIRNRFRHQILPLLKKINPAAEENIINTIENLKATETIMLQKVEQLKEYLAIDNDDVVKIDIKKLLEFEPLKAYLFELIRPYNFNSAQIAGIVNSMEGISGKTFYSVTHSLVKDRNELIISKLENIKLQSILISENDSGIKLPNGKEIKIEKLKRDSNFKISSNQELAALDLNKIKFPLILKEWEQGDFFYPLGMKQKKKLSDYFVDEKYSLIDKKEALLLTSDSQIVWLVGKRIDDRYKITDKTKNILLVRLVNNG